MGVQLMERSRMEKELRVLIVGSVACGPKVACRLKRLAPSSEITVFERGSDISYGACGMPYFVSGMVDRIDARGIQAFHSLRDAERLDAVLGGGKVENAVLVGAGLIGIEMAEALVERGLNVTMIEAFDWVMPALRDEETGRLAGRHLQAKGVNLAMGSAVTEFSKGGDDELVAVKTGKDEYPADLAVVAVGVRPNNELAAGAGLAIAANGGFAPGGEEEDRNGGRYPVGRAEPSRVRGDGSPLRRGPHPVGRAEKPMRRDPQGQGGPRLL